MTCHGPLMVIERWTPETCCGPAVEVVTICLRCRPETNAGGAGTTIDQQHDLTPLARVYE